MQIQNNEKNELIRKISHILFGILLLFLIINKIITTRLLFYILLLSIFISIFLTKIKNKKLELFLKKFSKKREKPYGRGILFFLFGSLLSLKIFQLDIAMASISILTFSDPISYIFGKFFGKIKIINNKNIEGTLCGIIAGTIIASFFINFVLAFIGCILAMVAEYLEFKIADNTIDDNLVIPLVAGTTMHFLKNII